MQHLSFVYNLAYIWFSKIHDFVLRQSLRGKFLNPILFLEKWSEMKNNFGLIYSKSSTQI